jgi:hypothetical protein
MTLNELLTDPEIIEALQELVSERRKKKGSTTKAADAGSVQDSNRPAPVSMNVEGIRTMGGLFEPPTDDYTPNAGLGLDFTGGLALPDETPSLTPEQAKQLGIFAELRRQFVTPSAKNLTADERRHRAMIEKARTLGREAGGLALPE